MILETVLFTALPTSRKGNDLFASVLISPQLGGEEDNPKRLPLSRYQDFANGRWAQIVTSIEWQLVLRWSADDSQEDYLPAQRVSADPDPELFAVMFPGDMPVAPFVFRNPADAQIVSYPAARLAADLDRVQESVAAASPEQRPMLDDLVSRSPGERNDIGKFPLNGFVVDASRQSKFALEIDQILATSGVLTTPAAGAEGTARSLVMLQEMLRPSVEAGNLRKPVWPDLDFHEVVSLLQSHPNLLRRLGLLVDLRVPITRIRRNTGNPRVFASIDWPPPYDPDAAGLDITTAFPRVRTTLGAAYFRPTPRKTDLTDTGYVNLRSAVAITSTVESEAIGTSVDATGTARIWSKGLETYGTPDRRGVPARHSAGVEIVRPDEAKRWKERMSATLGLRDELATGDDLLLDAEDLVMGYRVDIRRSGERTWHSLHLRHGVLTPYAGVRAQSPIDLGDDEGWSETAASAHPEDEVDGELTRIRIRETLAQWNGWSLSLPTPGQSLDADDRPSPGPTAADAPDLIASMHGTIDYTAPADGAKLPTLRFSKDPYEARLRWVDLGGNSAPANDTGGSILTFPYMRHDPVNSPDLFLTAEPVWSESVDVMVLRSGNAASTNRKTAKRWIAPPRSAAFFCLLHGVFDDSDGRPQAGMYATIAGRESQEIASRASATVENVRFVPADPGAVPYLPDPLADGLLIRGLPKPGTTYDRELAATYRGDWPTVEVASIEARAGVRNGASVSGDSIVVDLEPGRVAHLRVSHALTAGGLDLMDLWRRIQRRGNAERARKGAYWQLTPDRTLVVVHAVQRPVAPPQFVRDPAPKRWRATRSASDTAARIRGSLTVDAPSTESVDITGARTYAVDGGSGTDRPRVVIDADMGVVGTVAIPDPAPGGGVQRIDDLEVRAAFADTTRQQVTLTAEGKSRFAEYFRTTISGAAADGEISLNAGQPVVSGSVRVSYTTFDGDFTPTTRVAADTAYSVDAETGLLTVLGNGEEQIPSNAILSISFIPGPITASSSSPRVPADLRRALVTVPSSARPLAPNAEWILPAFTWSDPSGNQRSSTRGGGWLRVYLARPWFTSGLGEELAIVLQPAEAPTTAALQAANALVTQWALDPINAGGQLPAGSRQFPKSRHFDSGLVTRDVKLAEFDARVDIVRYQVGAYNDRGVVGSYDAERDMYVVDIRIDPAEAYRPFVRLALARYQPNSVDGLELSPVALVDVVQLEPDRTATVATSGLGNNRTARVTLSGRSYVRNDLGAGPGKAVAILERYDGPAVGAGVIGNTTSYAAWTEVRRVTLTGSVNANGAATWSGSLDLTAPTPPGKPARQPAYRIVLEQYELIRTDGEATASASLSKSTRAEVTGERLVHQDIIGI
jgi:hypothetical protein